MKLFSRKQPDNEILLKCEDIHCQMCADTVKSALGQVDGVLKVKVHVGKKTIAVSVDENAAVTSDMLINALKPTGYKAAALE